MGGFQSSPNKEKFSNDCENSKVRYKIIKKV